MKFLIPLLMLLPFFTTAQSLEIRNESKGKPAKIAANFKGHPVAGEEYTVRGLVSPLNEVKFIYMIGDTILKAEDHTDDIRKGVKWCAKKGELLLIIVKDKE